MTEFTFDDRRTVDTLTEEEREALEKEAREQEVKRREAKAKDDADFLAAQKRSDAMDPQIWQQIASQDIELEPYEQRVIRVEPTVSPFFKPVRIRFHGRRSDDGSKVPFSVIDAFSGDRVMFGTSLEDLFTEGIVRGRAVIIPEAPSPLSLLSQLQEQVEAMTRYGKAGLEMLQDKRGSSLRSESPKIRGMLTSLLVGKSGWGDILGWPIFSTRGLGAHFGIVAYNPWPFRIRASVSVEGEARMSAEEDTEQITPLPPRRIDRAFGVQVFEPCMTGVISVEPPNSTFFEPKRCRILCLDPSDPTKPLDLKIGAVTVGGTPQLAINTLTPNADSIGMHPEDFDYVDWSTFSTRGLAREMQMATYNPNEKRVVAFVCLEGWRVASLDCYV